MITLDAILAACLCIVFIGIIQRLFSLPALSWVKVIILWAIFVLAFSGENIYHRAACSPVTYTVDGKVTKFEWDCEKH